VPGGLGRRLAAAGGLALLATATLLPTADASAPAADARATHDALMSHELALADRLVEAAAHPSTPLLVDGIDGPAERRLGTRTLDRLRGDDGALVRNACLMPARTRGRVALDGGLGDPPGSACFRRSLRDAAAGAAGVVLDVARRPEGHRLWLATPVPGRGGSALGILSVEVDLEQLLAASMRQGSQAGAVAIVDLDTLAVLAAGSGSGGALTPIAPERLDAAFATLRGTPNGPPESGLASSGLVPLWKLADGRRLGLLAVPPVAAVPPSSPLPLEITLFAALVVLFMLAVVGFGLQRSLRQHRARERVEARYRAAAAVRGQDRLTGAGDLARFRERLAEVMATYYEGGLPFALAIVDIDDLAVVNDDDGHEAGDAVMVAAVRCLDEFSRPGDEVFRLDSDELAVLMPGIDAAVALEQLERALHFFRRPPDGIRPASFSAGIADVPRSSTDGDIVQAQARAALAWVKRHGRSAVEGYDPDRDHVPDQPHDAATQAVREVLAGNLLSPVFQPIVDLRNGRVLGFEGLVRPDPSGPLPSTSHLFAAASASGRTVELDLACIEVVLAGAREIGPDRIITLNLSPRTLEVKHFSASWLLDGILRNGIAPSRVIVELTERDAIGDMRKLQQTFRSLQEYGLRLAADDVGAGNSGLRLLSQVRFDIVKLDLSLVQDGVHQPRTRAVLESLRDLAVSQEAHIVAEGVETPEQLQVIRDLRIVAAQGYLLGRPDRSVATDFVDLRRLVPEEMAAKDVAPGALAVPSPRSLDVPASEPGPFAGGGWGLSGSAVLRR
jgi:diguanylate cyclase (GGDEF)-like protein